jgi:hypothetical protein
MVLLVFWCLWWRGSHPRRILCHEGIGHVIGFYLPQTPPSLSFPIATPKRRQQLPHSGKDDPNTTIMAANNAAAAGRQNNNNNNNAAGGGGAGMSNSDHVEFSVRAAEDLYLEGSEATIRRVTADTNYSCLMLKTQRFSSLFRHYAKYHGLRKDDLEYYFVNLLENEDTPESVQLQRGDTIMVR